MVNHFSCIGYDFSNIEDAIKVFNDNISAVESYDLGTGFRLDVLSPDGYTTLHLYYDLLNESIASIIPVPDMGGSESVLRFDRWIERDENLESKNIFWRQSLLRGTMKRMCPALS